MIDIRQTQNYANYLRSLGWKVERIDGINYFIKKIPILGSILKIQRPEKIRIDTIGKLCREYGVFQTIIEPKNEQDSKYLESIGFKLAKSTYLPSKTLQIDLTQSEEDILKQFKKDARSAIRKAGALQSPGRNRGRGAFTVHECLTPDEIKIFRKGWQKSVKFKRFVPSADQLINLKKSFPQFHSLFLTSHNIFGRIIGGVIFTTSSHGKSKYVTYYWQAFTNKEGRSTLSNYALLYHGILWAKRNAYKLFDFEGIYDPRFPDKSWLGFTHFKRSFGGYEVTYPGCYTKFSLFHKKYVR